MGVRVNAVAPGVIISSGTKQYPPIMLEKYVQSSRNLLSNRAVEATPAGRTGTPEEVAWLILYLASDQVSSFITGQTFYIDGGQSLTRHFQADGWTVPPSKRNKANLWLNADLISCWTKLLSTEKGYCSRVRTKTRGHVVLLPFRTLRPIVGRQEPGRTT